MTASTLAAPRRLSIVTKLAYGTGDLGPAIVANISGFFLNAFLLEVAGLRPTLAAAIFIIVKIWDSVNDPIIGTLTDRTNTRWGRRRPWLLFGAVPFGLAFFLQWVVPDLGSTGLFIYYLLVAILLDTGFTAVNVPYAAMTPELAVDYDERTSLNAYRFSFSVMGGTIALFVHTLIVTDAPAVRQAYLVSAAIWAGVIILSNLITFLFTRESYFKEESEAPLGFLQGLKIAFSNRPFIFVTLIYLLSWLAVQFTQSNLVLYVKYWADAESQLPFLLLTLQTSTFLFLLIWTAVSRRLGKQRVYYLGATIWILAGIALFFVPQRSPGLLYAIAPIAAMGVSVAMLVPWSLLPDVVDVDELETGRRREGIFYGFFVFLQKLGLSLGLAISNVILETTGYVQPDGITLAPSQPEPVLTALRTFVSLVPGAILLVSFLVVRAYPISRERLQEIQTELRARRA